MALVDEDIKRGLKKITKETEIKVAESILRWKYRKEGKKVPDDAAIARRSTQITGQAHQIIAKRGKNIWNELKKAYRQARDREGSSD